LADKTRLKILQLLAKQELCVGAICTYFDMTQPSISHHLDILKRAGLVVGEKRGREVHYRYQGETIISCCGKECGVLDIKLAKE
jgi:ArsR family transcriptional regulator